VGLRNVATAKCITSLHRNGGGVGLRTSYAAWPDHVTGMENIQDDPYCQGNGDPHDEVVRLEALIEELTAKIESCRKFILASRFVTWAVALSFLRCCLAQCGSIWEKWQQKSQRCSAALSCGVQIAAPRKKRRRNWPKL
jgi:hypothetical protein